MIYVNLLGTRRAYLLEGFPDEAQLMVMCRYSIDLASSLQSFIDELAENVDWGKEFRRSACADVILCLAFELLLVER